MGTLLWPLLVGLCPTVCVSLEPCCCIGVWVFCDSCYLLYESPPPTCGTFVVPVVTVAHPAQGCGGFRSQAVQLRLGGFRLCGCHFSTQGLLVCRNLVWSRLLHSAPCKRLPPIIAMRASASLLSVGSSCLQVPLPGPPPGVRLSPLISACRIAWLEQFLPNQLVLVFSHSVPFLISWLVTQSRRPLAHASGYSCTTPPDPHCLYDHTRPSSFVCLSGKASLHLRPLANQRALCSIPVSLWCGPPYAH